MGDLALLSPEWRLLLLGALALMGLLSVSALIDLARGLKDYIDRWGW